MCGMFPTHRVVDAVCSHRFDPWVVCVHHYHCVRLADERLCFPLRMIWYTMKWMDAWFMQRALQEYEPALRSDVVRWDLIGALCVFAPKYLEERTRVPAVDPCEFIHREITTYPLATTRITLADVAAREREIGVIALHQAAVDGPGVMDCNLVLQLHSLHLMERDQGVAMRVLNDLFTRSTLSLSFTDNELFTVSILYATQSGDATKQPHRVLYLYRRICQWYT